MDKKMVYGVGRWACLVVLPALVALVSTLGEIWGWEWSQEVCASISAIDACLGTCLGIIYSKDEKTVDGGVVVDDGGKIVDVVADEEGKNITEGKTIVRLSVIKESDNPYSGDE